MNGCGETETRRPGGQSRKLLGPRRRWCWLWLWLAILVTILVAQWLTAGTFARGQPGYLFNDMQPTTEKVAWYFLPSGLIVGAALFFLIAIRAWVPEDRTRSMIRLAGAGLSAVAIAVSMGISLWYCLVRYWFG